MFLSLMRARRFAPLFWCQFLSAFNDNFVRNLLAMLILFRLGAKSSSAYVTLAIGIFILPSLIFSAYGGELADSQDKAMIARRLKFAEIFVQAIAAAGFAFSSIALFYLGLFGLGMISALFGPVKYGILPDCLEMKELTAGNALVEGATFLAILLGTILGGLSAADGRSAASVVAQLLIIALACWATSLLIPATRRAAPDLKPDRNVFASTLRSLKELRARPREWIGGCAVSVFWLTGAVALSLIPVVVKTRAHGGVEAETAVSALFALGIGVGSIAAAVLARGRIFVSLAPGAAVGMAAFLLDLAIASGGATPSSAPDAYLSLADFARSAQGVRIFFDVFGLAAAGGLFVVPVFAAVQAWAGAERRARTIAAVNILNSLLMVGGSLVTGVAQALGTSEPALLITLAAVDLLTAAWLLRAFSARRLAAAPLER